MLIVSGDARHYRDLILEAEPDLQIETMRESDLPNMNVVREMDILFCWKFPRDLLAEAGNLRWIQSTGAGVDHIMAARPLPPGVVVTRMVDVFGDAMAEYVLGYIFALTMEVPRILRQQRERQWKGFIPALVRGKTAVVCGLGSIGREVCRTLSAAGLNVIGVSRRGLPVKDVEQVLPTDRLDEVLPRADYLVLVVPNTAESRGLISRERIALLPKHAIVVNIGRGALIETDALIEALQTKAIGGAVLDVFEQEPLPTDSPLWGLDNVIVTPHLAGPDDLRINADRFVENYRRFKAGKSLHGLVDLDLGY